MAEKPKKEEPTEKPLSKKEELLKDREMVFAAIQQTRNFFAAIQNELAKKEGALRYIDEKLKELEPKEEKPEPEGAAAEKPPLRVV